MSDIKTRVRSLYYAFKYAGLLLVILTAVGCVSNETCISKREELIGIWSARSETCSFSILRNSDGTYFSKGWCEYNLSLFEEKGRWMLKEDKYTEVPVYISNPVWKNGIGKEISADVALITSSRFDYMGYDSPMIYQKKIGKADAGRFNRLISKPIGK